MALTSAQRATLKADLQANQAYSAILADPNPDVRVNGAETIAAAYNATASPAYFVWRTDAPIDSILDSVTWANYTPADVPDNTVTYQNRAMAAQVKQVNLQLMLQGRGSFNASKPTLRGGLNDATTNLPTGAGGVTRSGGWTAIVAILRRPALVIEKLFAVAGSGVGNNGANARGDATNPDVMTYEGAIDGSDILAAWEG